MEPRRSIACWLGWHLWSCVGTSGYFKCDGTHHCVRCGYAPMGDAR